jgi:hypothetical protein
MIIPTLEQATYGSYTWNRVVTLNWLGGLQCLIPYRIIQSYNILHDGLYTNFVILGVRRPFGGRIGRAGGPVHYALYEPGGVL